MSILVPWIDSEPSSLILVITELIFNLAPSIFASGLILSLVIAPSVIPALVTPFSSIITVFPSAPLTNKPYWEPSPLTSPRDTLSTWLEPTPLKTCNLLPDIFKLLLGPATVTLDVSIVPAFILEASSDDIWAEPIAPSAITPEPAVIVPDANSFDVIEPLWILSAVMFPAKSVSISATSAFKLFIVALVASKSTMSAFIASKFDIDALIAFKSCILAFSATRFSIVASLDFKLSISAVVAFRLFITAFSISASLTSAFAAIITSVFIVWRYCVSIFPSVIAPSWICSEPIGNLPSIIAWIVSRDNIPDLTSLKFVKIHLFCL